MNYYERHIGDYLKDTAHLSLLEHGIYTRLMDVYYTRESGLPADVARLIGARSKEERSALVAVLGEFFTLTDGLHMQERCDREISRYRDKQSKAKASADARWSAQRSQSEGNANAFGRRDANDMRTHSEGNAPSLQTPDTSNQEKKKPARASRKTALPLEFGISERVRAWALERGFDRLDAHLDAFVRKATAKGYTNVSWDDAFMEAIREDWAKLRGRTPDGSAPPALAVKPPKEWKPLPAEPEATPERKAAIAKSLALVKSKLTGAAA